MIYTDITNGFAQIGQGWRRWTPKNCIDLLERDTRLDVGKINFG